MRRLLRPPRWLLGYEGIPLMARPTLRYEILSSLFAAGGLGLLVRQFTQLFARMALHASALVLAVLLAERAVGNLCGIFVARYLQRRRRVPYVVGGRVLIAMMMLVIALLPARPASAWPYAILLLAPAALSAVVLSMQTGVWQSNFPADVRGRLYSRLFVAKLVATGVSIKLAGYALDAWPWAHHLLYPLGAVCMLLSAAVYTRIRVRRERATLRESAQQTLDPLVAFRVLPADPAYAKFMFWQMISGGTVLMCLPVVTLALTEAEHLGLDWKQGTTALALVPFLVSPAGALLAGRLFDSMGITRYRAVGAALWALGRGLVFAAAISKSWALVLVAFAVRGLAQSTGGVAFNIGHTRFAPPERGQLYMGVHMSLQGLRGLTMPFLGVWLYSLVGIRLLPIATGIQLLAAAGFWLTRPPSRQTEPPAP